MAIYRRAGRPGVFGGVAALLLCAMLTGLVAGSARAAITYTDLYTLGTPPGFDSAGRQQIVLRSAAKPNGALMDLKEIELTPLPTPQK